MMYGAGKVFHTQLTETTPIPFSLCLWEKKAQPRKEGGVGVGVFKNHSILPR